MYSYAALFSDKLSTEIINKIIDQDGQQQRPTFIIWIVRSEDIYNLDDNYHPDKSEWLRTAHDGGYELKERFNVYDNDMQDPDYLPDANCWGDKDDGDDLEAHICYLLQDTEPKRT